MKAVLMSIKPKWVELILNGKKTVEVRKTAPKLETPFKVYVYETKGTSETPIVYEDGYMDFHGRGKVIAEFVCDYKYDLFPFGMGSCVELNGELVSNEIFCNLCCLTEQEICDYIGMRDGVGLHISELKEYDKPKELSKFIRPSNGCCNEGKCNGCKFLDKGLDGIIEDDCLADFDTDSYSILRHAPQSWQFVEELKYD